MHGDSSRLGVSFEFEAEGALWRVERTARRWKSGDNRAPRAGPGHRGPRRSPPEQVRAIDERVRELVGMDCTAFLRTTILPQNCLSRLLAEDDQNVRATVLRQLWRTDELDRAGCWVEHDAGAAQLLEAKTSHERGNHGLFAGGG